MEEMGEELAAMLGGEYEEEDDDELMGIGEEGEGEYSFLLSFL